MATTLYGRIQSQNVGRIRFALGIAPETPLEIPETLVDQIQELGQEPHGRDTSSLVSLTLKEPSNAESALLSAYADVLTQSLISLAAKLGSALDPAARASDACLRCIKRCKQIVVTEDNLLDQVICMLNCNDCGG